MDKKILNIGCGDDTYGTHFVDLSPSRPDVAKCDIDSENLPFEDGFFDEVYSKDVFEHLTNNRHFVNECARVLRKGGRIRIVTDNANSWVWAVAGTHLGGHEKLRGEPTEDRHYALFTDGHLKTHLRKAGLKTVSTKYLRDENRKGVGKVVQDVLHYILRITPLRRMAWEKVEIIGEKL